MAAPALWHSKAATTRWKPTPNRRSKAGSTTRLQGLTAGTTYTLSFYQAASQQTGFGNGLNTTEQWIVSLGTGGFTTCNGCGSYNSYYGSNESTYSNTDPGASIVATTKMTTPSGGLTNWNYVTINLTADAATQYPKLLGLGQRRYNRKSASDSVPHRGQFIFRLGARTRHPVAVRRWFGGTWSDRAPPP